MIPITVTNKRGCTTVLPSIYQAGTSAATPTLGSTASDQPPQPQQDGATPLFSPPKKHGILGQTEQSIPDFVSQLRTAQQSSRPYDKEDAWQKNTHKTFRKTLQTKKNQRVEYLDSGIGYRKLSCFEAKPSDFIFQRQNQQKIRDLTTTQTQISGTLTQGKGKGTKDVDLRARTFDGPHETVMSGFNKATVMNRTANISTGFYKAVMNTHNTPLHTAQTGLTAHQDCDVERAPLDLNSCKIDDSDEYGSELPDESDPSQAKLSFHHASKELTEEHVMTKHAYKITLKNLKKTQNRRSQQVNNTKEIHPITALGNSLKDVGAIQVVDFQLINRLYEPARTQNGSYLVEQQNQRLNTMTNHFIHQPLPVSPTKSLQFKFQKNMSPTTFRKVPKNNQSKVVRTVGDSQENESQQNQEFLNDLFKVIHHRGHKYDNILMGQFEAEINSALARPAGEWENQSKLSEIKNRLEFTTRMLAEAQRMGDRDKKFLASNVFDDVPKAKTQDQIFQAIVRHKQKMAERAFQKSLIMKGDNSERPDLNQLKQTTNSRFEEKRQVIVLGETSGAKDLQSRISINEKQLKLNREDKDSQVQKYVEVNLYSQEQRYKRANNRNLALATGFRKKMNLTRIFPSVTAEKALTGLLKLGQIQKQVTNPIEEHGLGFTEFQMMLRGDVEEMQKVSNILLDTVKYSEMFKKSQGCKMSELNPSDPKFQYLRTCQADLNLCLPVLDKIISKTLALYSYTLSEGHCKAVESACRFLDGKINRILLDNCGIGDDEFQSILQGLELLNGFESIVYKQNTFDELSMEAIKPILQKEKPNQLKELKIIDCKIPPWVSQDLVNELGVKCRLQKLSLVHCNLTDPTFKVLIKVVEEAYELTHLDLSWCERNSADFLDFYEALSKNKQLQHLSLSWNSLFDQKKGENDLLSDDAQTALDYLCQFIYENKELTHLDLSNTECQQQMMRPLIESIALSESLMAVHLDGNPGITQELMQFIETTLKSTPIQKVNHIPGPTSKLQEMDPQTMQDTLMLKANLAQKKLNECQLSIPTIDKKKLILERQKSFEHAIPGSDTWRVLTQEHQNCWICDQHIPTIFFWNEAISDLQTNLLPAETQKYFVDSTQSLYGQSANRSSEKQGNLPTVQGTFTNWQPVKLLELSRLCLQLTAGSEPDWLEELHDSGRCRAEVKSLDGLNEAELGRLQRMRNNFRQEFIKEWPRTVLDGCLPYKKCQLVNGAAMAKYVQQAECPSLLEVDVYCGIFFMKAGRQYSVVRHGAEDAWVQKDLIKFREEAAVLNS